MTNKKQQPRAVLGKESVRREQPVNMECPRWEATGSAPKAEGRRPED